MTGFSGVNNGAKGRWLTALVRIEGFPLSVGPTLYLSFFFFSILSILQTQHLDSLYLGN